MLKSYVSNMHRVLQIGRFLDGSFLWKGQRSCLSSTNKTLRFSSSSDSPHQVQVGFLKRVGKPSSANWTIPGRRSHFSSASKDTVTGVAVNGELSEKREHGVGNPRDVTLYQCFVTFPRRMPSLSLSLFLSLHLN